MKIRVALIGQPNVGKSSLFNVLVRGHVHVSNWPGTTVELHRGTVNYRNYVLEITDTPGVYGLRSVTLEERITCRNVFLHGYDVYVVLVDSTAPERTLNLAVELLELTRKVVVVFTKIDESHRLGIHINYEGLSRELGVPVIPVSVKTEFGIRELFDKIIDVFNTSHSPKKTLNVDYIELNDLINEATKILENYGSDSLGRLSSRGIVIKLFEGEDCVEELLKNRVKPEDWSKLLEIRERAEKLVDEDLLSTMRFYRRGFSLDLAKKYVVRTKVNVDKDTGLLRLFYNPIIGSFLGLTIYLSILTLIFTINTGFPLTTLLQIFGAEHLASIIENLTIVGLIDRFVEASSTLLVNLIGNKLITKFVTEAVIVGLGTILLFTPLILLVSIASAILEDSGLAPRLAIGLHTILSRFGLSGHATLPIILGFGCNVPSILSTRTLVNSYERLRLLITLSFIPCQARLIVFLATASALGSPYGLILVILSYTIALTIFIIINWVLFRISILKGEVYIPDILLEIPPVHKPLAKVVWWNAWSNTKHFLIKAGFIIFTVSVINWFILNYSPSLNLIDNPDASIGAWVARYLSPILKPIGIHGDNSWIPALALITGFIAKEIYLVTLLTSTGSTDLSSAFQTIGLGLPEIYALTVIVTLYTPCLATVATIYNESRSIKLTLATTALTILVAYLTGLITYVILRIII
ncbi:MAG: ferrous iron transport protein B [Desulfurococcaceae archaeon]